MKFRTNVDRLVKLGMLTALSIILVYAIHFPIFPSASFLEYDMADVPILIGRSSTVRGGVGADARSACCMAARFAAVSLGRRVMHFSRRASYVIAAGLIYRQNKRAPARRLEWRLAACADDDMIPRT